MKNITSKKILEFLFVGTLLVIPLEGIAQTQFHQATFESGNDGWTIVNGSRDSNSSYAYNNTYSMRIDHNIGEIQSPSFALSVYDKVDIRFHVANRGLDGSETFNLEYRPDAITAWTVVNTYTAGNISSKNADIQQGDIPNVYYAKTAAIFKTDVTFPSLATAQFRFTTNADNASDDLHIDLVTLTGTTYNTISEGPGGVTSNLELWLRADKLDGTGVGTDNTGVTIWEDTGKGNDASTVLATQAPTYKNNATDNINFNPVVEYSNSSSTSSSDMTYLTVRDEIGGTGGFYSHDMFVVVIPDEPINNTMIPLDTFQGKDPSRTTAQEDVTGFGYGSYTNRFVDEYFAYCIGTTSGPGNGYGKGDLTNTVELNQISIINARHNDVTTPTGQNIYLNNIDIGDSESDPAAFTAISNQKFYIGRSQYWNGSFGGRIAEVITYSATNVDVTASDARNRIQSYLAIKYGITLGVNGTSQDYVDSNGTTIWDQSADAGAFNYDIAGIGRSDAAGMMQRQSKSVNADTMVTMGITEITTTNSNNSNNIPINESYLVWGNDNGSLAAAPAISVDMSAGVSGLSTPVEFTSISRTWKVVETGGDVPEVAVSVPEATLSATITPPGSFLMFISDTPSFSPTSEYRVMTLNGTDLEAVFDFNGTKYITFGYAPQYEYDRSITFDGVQDYLDADDIADLSGSFTMSAWIKSDPGNTNAEIISKRNTGPFNTGYGLRIHSSGTLQAIWVDGSGFYQDLRSNTIISNYPNEWHHVALVYDGTQGAIYIDGVLDNSQNMQAPRANSLHLLIGASNYLSPSNWFDGTIDEVRIWNADLSVDQLRYIMNQEIEEHSDNTVTGQIIPQGITKNEVSSLDWPELIAYYSMDFYTFTNVNDNSGNNNIAAIRNLDTVDFQTAPLPYESQADGDWDTAGTWLNNTVQQLPRSTSIVDGSTVIDWNIVNINHDLTNSLNTTVLGSTVGTGAELIIDNDNKFEVTHYLELDGFLDLQGDSQLIQTDGSDLDVTSAGYLERDQSGTADIYTYNYWSSPVAQQNILSVNRPFNLTQVLNDGTDPNNPVAVAWTYGLNGAASSPITISNYWLFKYTNDPIGDYSSWQHVGRWGAITPGEGYTMKGPGTGGVGTDQNYTFSGKPNNDQTSNPIQIGINAGNNYLVGNPFPSALDANDFIADNPHLDGTLYFWEHWGGGSHELALYQGGYGMYNLSGGVQATSHPDVSGLGLATKTPGRYVPVAQGFFVAADSDGTINFNNSQRNFVKLGGSSVFMIADGTYSTAPKSGETSGYKPQPDDTEFDTVDKRTKLRIGFDSPIGMHRQLLLTFDNATTLDFDKGYDGKVIDNQIEDMTWLIGETQYAIQGIPEISTNASVRLPLYVKTDEHGEIIIGLDAVENMSAKIIPYLHDKAHNIFVDLREDYYRMNIEVGEYDDRFEIVLRNSPRQKSGNDEAKSASTIGAMHSKQMQLVTVFAKDEAVSINQVTVYSILGQQVGQYSFDGTQAQVQFESSNLSTGTYILRVQTGTEIQTTKILVNK